MISQTYVGQPTSAALIQPFAIFGMCGICHNAVHLSPSSWRFGVPSAGTWKQ